MSSLESSGLSEEHDPMAIVSEDEIAPAPEILTSESETDPEMMSNDEDLDDFQPFPYLILETISLCRRCFSPSLTHSRPTHHWAS
ncbi:hypothetical protein Hanom_Chr14g01261691 [Helianthus anomalus]